jgi:hypothetical protein
VRLPETPDLDGAFPRLSEPQLQTLAAHGQRRQACPGDVLYREGDERCDFFVVLEGKVAIIDGFGGAGRVVAVHGPRRFLGELGLLTGQAAFLTAVAVEPGEVLAVPVDRLRKLVCQDVTLGDLVLRASSNDRATAAREEMPGLGNMWRRRSRRFSGWGTGGSRATVGLAGPDQPGDLQLTAGERRHPAVLGAGRWRPALVRRPAGVRPSHRFGRLPAPSWTASRRGPSSVAGSCSPATHTGLATRTGWAWMGYRCR